MLNLSLLELAASQYITKAHTLHTMLTFLWLRHRLYNGIVITKAHTRSMLTFLWLRHRLYNGIAIIKAYTIYTIDANLSLLELAASSAL